MTLPDVAADARRLREQQIAGLEHRIAALRERHQRADEQQMQLARLTAAPCRKPCCDLHAGEVLHINDWHLLVAGVDQDPVSGQVFVVAEGFQLHYAADTIVEVDA